MNAVTGGNSGNDRKIDKIRRLCYVNREGFTPSLKTENRTLRPVTAPSGCIQQSAGVADRVAATTMPTFNTHITTPAPGLQYLSVSFTPAFPLQAVHSRLKNPTKPLAGLHLVLCKAHPGPLRVLPAVETRPAPGRDSLVPALPRQIWAQSEQRQRRLNWRLQAWDHSRSYCWSRRSTQAGEIIQLKRYKKRPADSRRTGRNLNPRGA